MQRTKKTRKDIVKKEIEVLLDVLEKKPGYLEVLLALADAYVETGDYRASFSVDTKVVELNPKEPIGYYNLACDCSMLGMIEDAYGALFTAVALGYNDIRSIGLDPDLKNLREDRRYGQFFNQLRQLAAETE